MWLPQLAAYWRQFYDLMMTPVSPKNLRLSAILIGIYQLLVAHVLFFLVLLGLGHAEQMKRMLAMDIEDQKDNGFYDMSPFRNQLRLRTASQLVSITEVLLYVLTGIISIYLFSTISLFVGIFKNRSEFIIPWLIVDFIFNLSAILLIFGLRNERFVEMIGGKFYYFMIGATIVLFDFMMWGIMRVFYLNLRTMNKLREIATVAIPCPPPGSIPYHFRRENMYIGSNGYKHILSESPDGNY